MLTPASNDPNRKEQLKRRQEWIDAGCPNATKPSGMRSTWGWIAREKPADWQPTADLPGATPDADEILTRRAQDLRYRQGYSTEEAWRIAALEQARKPQDSE
ncbi:hypothetical protein M8009_10360 [Halomonas sp. ATCH28]|uniref:Transposase n=1 Tax=Halomonas gemina TaxID=2945105 RepID=A0ABT0T1F8_9GAMM|nr:hypothetical protein [Halomonas gemina]MCL7940692.1 hypothetical protein [Halomonas gemina]